MSKSIHQLIPDIQYLLTQKGWFNEQRQSFEREISDRVGGQFDGGDRKAGLRLSQMGRKCPRALWCSVKHPELAERLPPWATFKYSFGHVIEGLAIAMAKAAGHDVVGEQDEIRVDGILGHRDCIIDGCLVDVKSSSSFGFKKFEQGTIALEDNFGYLDQLDGYLVGSAEDPLLVTKDRAYLLVIDKQLGHMCLYEHFLRERSIRERIKKYKQVVELPDAPPCECGTKDFGKSGNVALDVKGSYNSYKFFCDPNLRTFLYSSGPVYLKKVVKKPDVQEVDKYGNPVFDVP